MKLTKKCRKDFKDWYLDLIECDRSDKFAVQLEMDIFDQMLDSAKFGIIVDFADTAGCYLEIEPWWDYPVFDVSEKLFSFDVYIHLEGKEALYESQIKTRAEARVKAVEMFNNHYNLVITKE